MNYRDLKPELFETLPKGEKINARLINLESRNDVKVFIFRDVTECHICLLQTDDTSEKLPEIKGVDILYQYFSETGGEMVPYIQIACKTKSYLENFADILKEILADFDRGTENMAKSVQRIISKWKYFLSEPKNDILSEENIIGLLGELLFLEKLLRWNVPEALKIWTAERGEEDFVKDGQVVEVKSTIKAKHEHIINGIDQLLLKPGQTKYILSLLFIKSDTEISITIPSKIKLISDVLSDFPESHDLFFRKLKSRGYDPRDSDLYLDFSYSFVRGGYFKVNETFPKLTTDELLSPLSSRISRVRYLLDLEGLSNSDFNETEISNIF